MAGKSSIQELDRMVNSTDLIIPCDYVNMKNNFKKELVRFYFNSALSGRKILDLNPGFDGIWNELSLLDIEYLCLEQNPHVRSFLENKGIKVMDWKVPKIPLGDSSVDYVLIAPFIEHLPTYADALKLMLEVKRILKTSGKVIIIFPNFLSLKEIYFEDYKHGWVTTKKRISDMLLDCQFHLLGTRYTIGWITMRRNIVISFLRFFILAIMWFMRFNIFERLMETCKLENIAYKFKKTFFELIVIEAQIKK